MGKNLKKKSSLSISRGVWELKGMASFYGKRLTIIVNNDYSATLIPLHISQRQNGSCLAITSLDCWKNYHKCDSFLMQESILMRICFESSPPV